MNAAVTGKPGSKIDGLTKSKAGDAKSSAVIVQLLSNLNGTPTVARWPRLAFRGLR